MMQVTLENAFDDSDEFGTDQGLFFAFSLDGIYGSPLPPEVGEFKVNVLEWGTQRTGVNNSNLFELTTHACSDEELGIRRTEKTTVFPLAKNYE